MDYNGYGAFTVVLVKSFKKKTIFIPSIIKMHAARILKKKAQAHLE